MELVALISSGKGSWGQVAGLVNRGEWDNVILIVNEFAKSRILGFDFAKKTEMIFVNFDSPIKEVIKDVKEKLKGKIKGVEVSLSLASGEGREHMSLISALLQVPVGIKFVALTKEGIIEF